MYLNLKHFYDLLGREIELQVSDFQVNSEFVQEEGLFFALKGSKVDGHSFLEDVAKKGAIGAIVEKGYEGTGFGLELFYVENVLKTLQEMAKRTLGDALVIGITGSYGKTTTKEFISSMLGIKWRVWQSPKNYNSKIGLPLSLLARNGDEDIIVQEMGMTHKGDISKLVEILPLDVGVLTKVDLVHSLNFPGGVSEIFEEKHKIFKTARKGIYPHEWKGKWSEGFKSFSMEDHLADYFLKEEKIIEMGNKKVKIDLPLKESHFQEDLLIAYGVCRELGMKIEEIKLALKGIKPPALRFERVEKDGILWIKDMYNASYPTMKSAMENLPKNRRRIGVLGEIKELGSFSKQEHQKVGIVAAKELDELICLGSESKVIVEAFSKAGKKGVCFSKKDEVIERLKRIMQKGDVILIKGSRSLKMETIFLEICD